MRALQGRVFDWVRATFGSRRAWSKRERVLRVFEETCELAQSVGLERDVVLHQLHSVYDRDVGDPEMELAQVGVALLAAASSVAIDLEYVVIQEMDRVESIDQDEWDRRIGRKEREGLTISSEGERRLVRKNQEEVR